ncbi:MAG: uroporphyrinogen-III synthase [Gammaproteobacteria bacterium]|nr:uroporphyrinogen-III synthase [Gammaproteobacteria bacterium]
MMNGGSSDFAAERPLAGVRVMVTRAPHQAHALCDMIEAAGGGRVRLPALEISAPENPAGADRIIGRLAEFEIAIFVSQNAVNYAHERAYALGTNFAQLKLAAIGDKTAAALQRAGRHIDICPRGGFTTEDLLKIPEMRDVQGRHIVIFRGEGGRELLGAILQARGALVVYAEVYRRTVPRGLSAMLRQCLESNPVDIIAIASGEALSNLDDACAAEYRTRLHRTWLLVGSSRMRAQAEIAGFSNIEVADDPGDEAMFERLSHWASHRVPTSKTRTESPGS